MLTMMKLFMALKRDERGISALEYAVLAALILGAIVVGLSQFDVAGLFTNAATEINAARDATAP